ncbi:hypothetical protein [Natronococcus sp.]|uniref:hypothetical protein n=1 Tax=Natronococcus sp. TaxID=35747 RepID=UPI003A4DB4FB
MGPEHARIDEVTTITFGIPDETGIDVIDPIERRRCRLRTPNPLQPTPVRDPPFEAPVDAAINVSTTAVVLDQLVDAYVRNAAGEVIAPAQPGSVRAIEGEHHTLEISGPIKLYFGFSAPGRLVTGLDRIRLEFDRCADVVIGARSYHTRPAATITTTADPESIVRSLSYLGSALKTTACERSFPTLRGHPPMIELGDTSSIPDHVTVPETGVHIDVEPTLEAAYVVAPLAYYLGADVAPASNARLRTDHGFSHRLSGPRGFAGEVERVLKQVFFLDCLTRSAGPHQLALHEYDVVSSHVDLDFAALYGRSLADQLEAYLSVPYESIEGALPRWNRTAYIEAAAEQVEAIPFVAADLAVVRTVDQSSVEPTEDLTADAEPPDSSGDVSASIELPRSSSVGCTWFGDGIPIEATKGIVRAYQNRFERSPTEGPIEIAVVCNDRSMLSESSDASDVYDSHDELPFDVTTYENCTVAELRAVLESDVHFLHYMGHIDENGFRCRDGTLEATRLDTVGVNAFLLNACRSYHQGLALIEAGSVGGIVTLADVVNSSAIRMGYTVIRLLELGFPLQEAVRIARDESLVGAEYVVVGDGAMDITQERSGAPTLCSIESDDDGYAVSIRSYLSRDGGMGTVVSPSLEGVETNFLAPGELPTYTVSSAALAKTLNWRRTALEIDGQLVWPDDAADLFD